MRATSSPGFRGLVPMAACGRTVPERRHTPVACRGPGTSTQCGDRSRAAVRTPGRLEV